MTDMMNMAINDAALDNVTGGATRTVKNNSLKYANVREGAGLSTKVITKINNGTKVKTTGNKIRKDGYVWYPVLAKDTVKFNGVDQANNRPIPVYKGQEVKPDEEPNPLGLYSTWRIYVKTGEDGFKYRYSGSPWDGVDYDHRPVAIEDYEFAFRNLLNIWYCRCSKIL